MKLSLWKVFFVLLGLLGLYVIWISPKPTRVTIGDKQVISRPDGAKIAYYASGDKQAPRVILLASLGRSVSDFNELVAALNIAGYRTIAVESRNIGSSTQGRSSDVTLYDLAEDAHASLQDDEVGQNTSVYVIGHAFGNRVARAYATQFPKNVKGIVLVAAGGTQKLQPDQRETQALLNSFNWKIFPPKRKAEIRYAFFADTSAIPSYWIHGWYKKAAEIQIKAVFLSPEPEWRAGGGIAPILVLQASHDKIAPAATTSDILKASYKDRVRVVNVGPAGHALLPEKPEVIAAEITQFLNNIELVQ